MSTFTHAITKVIVEYKNLIKKFLSPGETSAKIKKLGLKPKQLKNYSEVQLYNIGMNLIKELELIVTTEEKADQPHFHHGTNKFLNHLKKQLKDYCVEGEKVISLGQKASRALLSAIQLLELPEDAIDEEISKQLELLGKTIAKYGSHEQIDFFNTAIKQHKNRHSFFATLLDNFSLYINKPSSTNNLSY